MATQTVEFLAVYGSTLTARLYAVGGSTIIQTASAVTEISGKPGVYLATFTDAPAAEYELHAYLTAGTVPVARWYVTLTLTTATFAAYDTTVRSVQDKTGYSLVVTPPTAAVIADAVWDEAYAGHTTAGTFGKLMDILRKSNTVVEGTVLATPTPTASVFRISGADYPTGAMQHAVLWFASGPAIEQNNPILTWTNNGDGTVTITLEAPLVTAPTAGDLCLIAPSSHVHAIAEIQSGLATLANQGVILDRTAYALTVLAGACSDAQTAAETYVLTLGGNTFTVDYSGLDASGNRSTTTLSKV